MLLAELFAGCLCVAMVAADWWQFWRLTASAGRYGCPVARAEDTLPVESDRILPARFGPDGLLQLEHGIARVLPDERRILLRSQPSRFSSRFHTAWPLKGAIEWDREDGTLRLRCVKLMPWSSALLTLLWFAIVGVGTLAFIVKFLAGDDGLSLGGRCLCWASPPWGCWSWCSVW
jgi:hypothetical protein